MGGRGGSELGDGLERGEGGGKGKKEGRFLEFLGGGRIVLVG